MWTDPAYVLLALLSSLDCACGWSSLIRQSRARGLTPAAHTVPRTSTTSTSTRLASSPRSFVLDDDYDEEFSEVPDYASEYDPWASPKEDPEDSLDTYSMSDEELEATMGDWDEGVAKFNTIHLTGRIGNDPEPRYFDDGKVVVNLSLATKRKYHSLERQTENIQWGNEETDWYALEVWGTTAEFVSKYVDRGTHVSIIGSLQIDEWTARDTGELRNKAKVIVRDFDILESKEEADARRSRSGNNKPYNGRNGGGGGGGSGPGSAGSGDFF